MLECNRGLLCAALSLTCGPRYAGGHTHTSAKFFRFPLQPEVIGVYWLQQVRAREKGHIMWYDLRDEQTIIVINTWPLEGDRYLYEGKVGDMPDEIRSRLRIAGFYLLDNEEEYDVIAII